MEQVNKDILASEIAQAILKALENVLPDESIPEFPTGEVPVAVAAKVYGKDASWVRAGIVAGWLPIGRATRKDKLITDISQIDSKQGNINYHISPKKLWEDTGFIWRGERKADEVGRH